MPLLSSKLPAYSGPYAVGSLDIEVPCEKRQIAGAVFKDTGKPAFELETVLFTLYYPASKGSSEVKPPHKWVSNIAQHAEGYARFAHSNNTLTIKVFEWALWTLIGSTTIPADVDAPIFDDASSSSLKFPVIVFSHGMASSRTSYTHWCGELASRGYVVAAIEHRDGSGPGTEVLINDNTPARDVFHISQSQLDPEPEEAEFKVMQLAMREAEVEETVRILKQINQGAGLDVFKTNSRNEGQGLMEWKGRLNEDAFVMGGHSYGATLALQALKGSPSTAKRPFIGGIILDPGKHSGPLNDDIDVPIVIINSQSWSSKFSIFQGRAHFEVVKDLVLKVMHKTPSRKSKAAWFLTSKGTTHPSVTDAPLIEPLLLAWTTGSSIDAREGVMQYVKVAEEFMRFLDTGKREGVLAEEVTHPEYDEDTRSEDRKTEMSSDVSKYWQVHVSPPFGEQP